MKKLLGLFTTVPFMTTACGGGVEKLPTATEFITEFGDLNVYNLDTYYDLNNGDLVTLQLKLESMTPGSAWGYEVRFSDATGTTSQEMAEEIFGLSVNRLFFSFPDEVADQLEVGNVYLMEFAKDVFPPNGRPQFGFEGSDEWGIGTDTDGKICSVAELSDCDELTNNIIGEYSSLTNLREGGSHIIKTKWIGSGVNGISQYYGLGNEAEKDFAYSDSFGEFDHTSLVDGKEYIFEIKDTDWDGNAHGTGDYYNSIEIVKATAVE